MTRDGFGWRPAAGAAILCCWVGLAAAATPSVGELLSGAALGFDSDPPGLVRDDQVLAVSDEMREFLDVFVDQKANHYYKLNQLSYAIINDATFGLEYDESTRTAADTFAARRGNCLSFSNMYVAMARHVGLNARFQEVDIPPDWTYRDDAFVLNRHVNVVVSGGSAGRHVIDFNLDDFKSSYDQMAISDSRAIAHFYNNSTPVSRRWTSRPTGPTATTPSCSTATSTWWFRAARRAAT
jgi:hypothetical protein